MQESTHRPEVGSDKGRGDWPRARGEGVEGGEMQICQVSLEGKVREPRLLLVGNNVERGPYTGREDAASRRLTQKWEEWRGGTEYHASSDVLWVLAD